MVASIAVLAFGDVLIKGVSPAYPLVVLFFFRNVFACVPLAGTIWWPGLASVLRTRRLGTHVLRGTLSGITMAAYFTASARCR